jgi:AraC family transcriptional regulator
MPVGMGKASVLGSPSSMLLGEKHQIRTLEIPAHEHDHFCIHLQTAGHANLRWWWSGKHGTDVHHSGSLILLPPGTRDRLRWEGFSERYVFSLDADYVKAIAEQNDCRGLPEFRTRWQFRDSGLHHVLSDIGNQFASGWPLGRLYADLLSLRLATALLVGQTIEPLKLAQVKGGLCNRKLQLCLAYLTENAHRDVSLSEAATVVGLSPFHFARLFRKASGTTPYNYHEPKNATCQTSVVRHGRIGRVHRWQGWLWRRFELFPCV